jgi:outer membrane protein assembly factor BamB
LHENSFVDWIRFSEILDDFVIFSFEYTDSDSAGTIIALINLANGHVKWQQSIPAFNSSPLLISNDSVYVGGIGYVARIDRNNGKILWFHGGFYERATSAYNSFDKPYFKGNNVVFPNDPRHSTYPDNFKKRIVVVNIETGELVSK